jgi:hypothetical protein
MSILGVKKEEFDEIFLYSPTPITSPKLLQINTDYQIEPSSNSIDFSNKMDTNNGTGTGQTSLSKLAINTTTNNADTDLEIRNTNPKITLYSPLAGTPSIDLIRGLSRTFNADGNFDFRIENNAGYLNIIKGISGTNTNMLVIRDDIGLNENTSISANKNLTLSGTGKITTPNMLVSGLSPSKMVLTDGSDNLISSAYTDSDFALITANNVFTGLNTFNQDIKCNSYQATTTSSVAELFTDLTGNAIYIGNITNGNALQLNQPTFIGTGRNLTLSSTGILRSNKLESLAGGSNLDLGTNLTTGSINLSNSTATGAVNVLSNFNVGTNALQKGITCAYYQAYANNNLVRLFPTSTTGEIRLGEALTTANLNLHNATGSGVINANADIIFPTTKRIRVDRIVGSTPLTSNINLGYTDPLYTASILLNQKN